MRTLSTMRIRIAVGLVSATLILWACSDSTGGDTPDAGGIDSGTDTSTDAAANPDTSSPIADAGSDVATNTCNPTPSTDQPDQFCFINGACPSCADAGADRVFYQCSTRIDGGNIGQPLARMPDGGSGPLADCSRLTFDQMLGLAEYCCPAGVVSHMPQDNDAGNPFCPPAKPNSYISPANADGTSILAAPPGCVAQPAVPGSKTAAFCCD